MLGHKSRPARGQTLFERHGFPFHDRADECSYSAAQSSSTEECPAFTPPVQARLPSPAPTRVGTQSATPSGLSSSTGPSDPRITPTSTTTPGASDDTGSGAAAEETIQLEDLAASARPFEAVRIQGTYRGGTGTFLRVQRWREAVAGFPVTHEE